MTNPHENDFTFILNRLINYREPQNGVMHILIAETVVFQNGKAAYFVKQGGKNKYGKFRYVYNEGKLKFNEIKKYYLEQKEKYKYLEFPTEKEFLIEKKAREENKSSVDGIPSTLTLSKEKLQEIDLRKRQERKRERDKFRMIFRWIESKLKYKKYLGGDFEICDLKRFTMIMQYSTVHHFWEKMDYFQKILFNSKGERNVIRSRFVLER